MRQLLSVFLLSVASNLDNFGVGAAYQARGYAITIGPNLLIAIANSLGTFVSVFFGEVIHIFLPEAAANFIGGFIFVCLGLYGFVSHYHSDEEELIIDNLKEVGFTEGIVLALSLSISNVAGGISAGIIGLDLSLVTCFMFIMSILMVWLGALVTKLLQAQVPSKYINLLSASLLVSLGIYKWMSP